MAVPVSAGSPDAPVGQIPGTGTGPPMTGLVPPQVDTSILTFPANSPVLAAARNSPIPAPSAAGPSQADIAAGMAYGASQFQPSPDYAGQFAASLGAQRQALDNALNTSLAQLAGRRDAAAKVIAGIPSEVQGTFQAAEGRQANVTGNADKAVGTGKPGGAMGGDINAGLYQQDLKQNMAAGKAIEPLLQLGATANYDLGAAGLNQQQLAGMSALADQQAAFDAQMAQQRATEQFQLAHTAPPETFAQKQDLAGIDPNTGVPFSVEANAGRGGMSAYEAARIQQGRDDQANRAGYTSYANWQLAEKQGRSLLAVLSDPAADQSSRSDASAIVKRQFDASSDLKNWLKVNDPTLYATWYAPPSTAKPKL